VRCGGKLKSRRGKGGREGAKRAATVLCDPPKRTRPAVQIVGEVAEVEVAGRPRSSNRLVLARPTPLGSRPLRLKPLPNSASCCPNDARPPRTDRLVLLRHARRRQAEPPSRGGRRQCHGPTSRLGKIPLPLLFPAPSVLLSLQHYRFAVGIAI
jgi:hypothetical protein